MAELQSGRVAVWQSKSVVSIILHPVTAILVGFLLRLILLNAFPLREDEAIYGSWALHFLHEDPWFLHVWPDKPPIFIWLLSAAFSIFGETPSAGRFLNILISTLAIPVSYVTARKLWGQNIKGQGILGNRAGGIAAWAMALNPFAISFAATLFTDPMLVLAGSLALYLALARRTFWAGIWLAIAIMTKQQGLLYVPLVLGVVLLEGKWVDKRIPLGRFFLGLLLITLTILFWDSQRWAVAPSPWDWSMRNYAPLRVVPSSEWASRLWQWSDLLWYLTASWLVWEILLLITISATILGLMRINNTSGKLNQKPSFDTTLAQNDIVTLSPCHLVTLWSLAFLALHITTTLQIWDRYLLPLAPMMALGVGWLGKDWRIEIGNFKRAPLANLHSLATIFLLCAMFLPAWSAATGQLPIGGDHGAYRGFDEILSNLQSQSQVQSHAINNAPNNVPNNTNYAPRTTSLILYHRALGWHYQFYLYDAVRSGKVELRWFPNSIYLADNATQSPHLRKFLIQPVWSPVRDLEFHLRSRGLQLAKIAQNPNFTLYEIVLPPQPFCNWCFSSVHRPFPTLTGIAAPAMICAL